MKIGDLVKLKRGADWGIGILRDYNPVLGCWWVHWPHGGLCFQSEHRLELL